MTTPQPQRGCSFTPLKKTSRTWSDTPLPLDGQNSELTPVQCFAEAARFVLANAQSSFDLWTFVNLLKSREEQISFAQLKTYFGRWTKEQAAQGRIKQIPSCMDDATFVVLSK